MTTPPNPPTAPVTFDVVIDEEPPVRERTHRLAQLTPNLPFDFDIEYGQPPIRPPRR